MEGRQRPRLTFCSLVGDKETDEMVSLLELILQLITGNDNFCLEVWHWCSCGVFEEASGLLGREAWL